LFFIPLESPHAQMVPKILNINTSIIRKPSSPAEADLQRTDIDCHIQKHLSSCTASRLFARIYPVKSLVRKVASLFPSPKA
jgi:hypothetical protein